MAKVDESYAPGDSPWGWQGGAHLTIGFTGDLIKWAEIQLPGFRVLGRRLRSLPSLGLSFSA